MTLLQDQLARLAEVHPGVTLTELPGGQSLVHVPAVPLAKPGWSKDSTAVWFVVPVGYPQAAPDCFWAEAPLMLATGAPPHASNVQPVPGLGQPHVWFSWHVQRWNPNRDTLLSWVYLIRQRLNEAR